MLGLHPQRHEGVHHPRLLPHLFKLPAGDLVAAIFVNFSENNGKDLLRTGHQPLLLLPLRRGRHHLAEHPDKHVQDREAREQDKPHEHPQQPEGTPPEYITVVRQVVAQGGTDEEGEHGAGYPAVLACKGLHVFVPILLLLAPVAGLELRPPVADAHLFLRQPRGEAQPMRLIPPAARRGQTIAHRPGGVLVLAQVPTIQHHLHDPVVLSNYTVDLLGKDNGHHVHHQDEQTQGSGDGPRRRLHPLHQGQQLRDAPH
mmetsp:Transcript_86383/g.196992  ORF Transcript_86383/g.196992 Transcript_86383/m.196992 type:complete len:257 (-) Transcript_86383:619-1389(-)